MANNTEEKQGIDTNSTELTTDTSDIPQPFPAPLTRPVTPDTNGTSTADSAKEEPSQSHSPGQTEAVISQPILPGRTAIAPQITTATQATAQAAVTTPVQTPIFVSNKNHIQIGELEKDIAKYKLYANRKTGFANIDATRPFWPGLYLISSETSVANTNFVLQWCDQIAIQGEYVLYFAFEQSKSFLMSKSISRQCFLSHREDEMKKGTSDLPIYISSDIRNEGVDGIEVDKQTYDNIKKIDDRMFVVSTNFNGDIDSICKCIEDFIQQTGHKPVVVIDYFNLLPPVATSIDQGIHKLKMFQMENDLTVLTISSVSRMDCLEEFSLSHVKGAEAISFAIL